MLVRWRPLDEFFNLYQDVDNMFRRVFRELTRDFEDWVTSRSEEEWLPRLSKAWIPVEAFVDEGKLHLRMEVPGVDPKDLDISVTGQQLVIRGQKTFDRKVEEANFLRREIAYGSFERVIPLPEGVNTDQIEATYHNGVLELVMPAPAALKVKKVQVKVLEAPKTAGAAN
ncbi:MAG: Hsp20 family protein [Blastocatellia bacterium]|nr:Hsp20 family protein [Blastocatellia bacterium]MCS7158298.1 Hsp20 family protein [Blastocatellia bacterium]MCX7753136.1 Hsp20 family protein [Blastocatellia bacterium]MDW8169451.1 Hsp20 family protein [Acidobacteriota bacterium]MDW8255725.1 Hsp20 family protein [Acidobacteriota bacterium]